MTRTLVDTYPLRSLRVTCDTVATPTLTPSCPICSVSIHFFRYSCRFIKISNVYFYFLGNLENLQSVTKIKYLAQKKGWGVYGRVLRVKLSKAFTLSIMAPILKCGLPLKKRQRSKFPLSHLTQLEKYNNLAL